MLVADFHVHTKYSYDCHTEPRKILERARKLNFNVLGITDHNTTKGAIETKKIAKDILILVGQEIATEQGDVIIFGIEENLKGDLFEIIDKARERDALIVLPHPFDIFRNSVGKLAKDELIELASKIHAMEVFNSRCFLNKFNKKAQNFSRENNIVGIAGSDSHILSEIGNVRNFLDCGTSEEEIFKTIKSGKIAWQGKKTCAFNFIKKFFEH